MPTLYKLQYIDSVWFKSEYNTAFEAKWDALNQDEQFRMIELAATRVKRICNRPFIDLKDLELEQASGVQVAMGRVIDYWLEYGLDLNRISGSVSLGSFSASQTAPNDPDYIPENVYEVLQDVNLYTPVGYINERDLYRADDENAITYGVRFKGLERVKDITIAKSTKQDAAKEAKNIDLQVPTLARVKEEIDALGKKLTVDSHKTIIGELTVADVPAMDAAITSFNQAGVLTLNDGRSYSNAVSVPGDIIFFLVSAGKNEEAIVTTTGNLELLTSNNANARTLESVVQSVQTLGTNKLSTSEGDVRYLRVDGSVDMAVGYTPVNAKSVVVKEGLDSVKAEMKQKDDLLNERLTAIEEAASITDLAYLWDGVIANQHLLTASFDLKTLNPAFTFAEGKKSELAIQRISTGTLVSHPITATAATTQVEYAWAEDGGKQINIDTNADGVLTVTFGNGVNTSNYRIFEVVQKAPVSVVSNSYTKAEADAKYAVNNDASLTTTAKHLNGADGAINELKALADGKASAQSVTDLTAVVGAKVAQSVYDAKMLEIDTKLGTIPANPLTEAHVTSLINAAIAAALSKLVTVTFTDNTQANFKIASE